MSDHDTNSFLQDIIAESDCEIEDAPWWMSEAPSHSHHYPAPIGYHQIHNCNQENENEEKQHNYPTPQLLHQPLVMSSENLNRGVPLDEHNSDLYIQPIHYELQLVYKKLLLSSIIACFVSVFTVIGGILFYRSHDIILYFIVLLLTLFGIFCGAYNENNKQQNKALLKLKCLLIYFISCCILSLPIFGVEIYQLISLLIHYWPSADNNIYFPVLFGNFVFFFGGILFCMILVLFYIDLISRAALKRGRIGFIISDFNKKQINANICGFNELQNNSFWVKIFGIIICFRCKFRNIRRGLTKITGISFVKLKPILSMTDATKNDDVQKEHEEDKIKAILEEGDSVGIVYGPKFIKRCLACNEYGENEGNNDEQVVCWRKYGSSVLKAICILILLYIFLPLWVLVICVLFVSLPGSVLIKVMKEICDCGCRIYSTYNIISVFVGFVIWIYLWFWLICPNATMYGKWNWNTQCNMWYYSMFIYVRSIIKSLTMPLFN